MKKTIMLILCIALTLSLAACSASENDAQELENTVIIKDMKGEVAIPANPQRIVDVAGLTAYLFRTI